MLYIAIYPYTNIYIYIYIYTCIYIYIYIYIVVSGPAMARSMLFWNTSRANTTRMKQSKLPTRANTTRMSVSRNNTKNKLPSALVHLGRYADTAQGCNFKRRGHSWSAHDNSSSSSGSSTTATKAPNRTKFCQIHWLVRFATSLHA